MVAKIRSGFAFGKNKGFKNTPLLNLEKVNTGKRRSYKPSENIIFAKQVAEEICGLAPYEKKAIDMLEKGNEKRCKKFIKTRLGNMKRTKNKLAYLTKKMTE